MWLLAFTAAIAIAASNPAPERTQSTLDYRESTHLDRTPTDGSTIAHMDGTIAQTDRTLDYRDPSGNDSTNGSAIVMESTLLRRVVELPAFNATGGELPSETSGIATEGSTVLLSRDLIENDPTANRDFSYGGEPSTATLTHMSTASENPSAPQSQKTAASPLDAKLNASAFPYTEGGMRESGVRRVEESPAYASSVVLASDVLSLSHAVSRARGAVCREQGYRFLDGLLTNKRWALKMFDASAKSPQGLLFGSSYHLGNFDECVGISEDGEGSSHLTGQYCLATIDWTQSEAVRKRRSGRSGELRWAVCTPASCDSAAVQQFVLDVLSRAVGNVSRVFVDKHDCYTRRPIEVNDLDITFLCLMCFFVVVIIASTAYDVCRDRKGEVRGRVLRDLVVSFSASHNLRKLLSTKQPNGFGLDCIAGIKTLAMVFITAGHACLFIASGPVMDAEAWDRLLREPLNSFMLNNTLLVDTFLMLSAFLFSRLLLLELDKRRGRLNILPIYIFRYIRVTPAYLVVILFYMTWLPKSGEGPLWKDKIQLEQERCAASWWTNILYVNNYVHSDNLCMFQSWYLSVDTQMFLLAPAFIYPLWRWRRVGPAILVAAIAVSSAVPAAVTYENLLDPTLMVYAKEFKDISQNHFFRDAYIKTHMKMTPYFMGLLFGYILHRVQANNYVFSRRLKVSAWVASVVLGTSVVFSISVFYQEWYQYSVLDATSYAALHKLAWGLANGWLILACATGNGGFLGKLLTWKFLVPLSRLTFCAYLVNGVVELYYVGTLRHPLHISFFNVLAIGVAHIILTFILAVMLCLVFESPIHGIEKVLLRSFGRPSDNARVEISAENSSSRSTSQPKLDA